MTNNPQKLIKETLETFDKEYGWLYRNTSEKNGQPIWIHVTGDVKDYFQSALLEAYKVGFEEGRNDG